jgi:hypothetical protein
MTKEQFLNTVWYRLLQVIFIGSFIILLIFTIGIFRLNEPEKYIDDTKSSITCISGDYKNNTYSLSKNSLYIDNWSKDLSDYGKDNAKKLCAYNKISITFNSNYPTPILDNYKLNIVYGIRGSWINAIGFSLLYIIFIFIFFWFIKRLIFFIAFGDNILKKPKKLFD